MVAMNTAGTINSTFWAILVTQRLHIPDSNLALFTFARSAIMLVFFFVIMPSIREMKFRNPMVVGFIALAVSQIILIIIPEKSYMLLLVSTLIEA